MMRRKRRMTRPKRHPNGNKPKGRLKMMPKMKSQLLKRPNPVPK